MFRSLAHVGGPKGEGHELVAHLRDVAAGARRLAEAAKPTDSDFAALAEWSGWLHDLGKYRDEFQKYLLGKIAGSDETQHAVFGAAWAYQHRLPAAVALSVLGHHAGLHDFSNAKDRVKNPVLNPLEVAEGLMSTLKTECNVVSNAWPHEFVSMRGPQVQARSEEEVRIRMLFSCLVDADYLDTEVYMTGRERDPVPLNVDRLFGRLDGHVRRLSEGGKASSAVNQVRREVYQACIDAADRPMGCFSLTAPTGSGKTLAAMAFALKHVQKHGLRRVIVVLPFLAIIEQNARAYREVLTASGEKGVVIEHHSAVSLADAKDTTGVQADNESMSKLRSQQATENWDAPVIVTTAVQFLESLFSRRPGRCRKLHNIARSVVVFDEVQTLPFPLLDPILSVVRDLREHYGVSFLFSSATRPEFGRSSNLPSGFRAGEQIEILGESDGPSTVSKALSRVRLELAFLNGKWTWNDLHERLIDVPCALVIVNLRKHAQDLYDRLKTGGAEGLFHLSSTMCAAHREAILGRKDDPQPGTIYYALKCKFRCIVISTQVVEAGVDLDFPVVFRAIAPLDAIIQAAGRCDREGDLTAAAGAPAGRLVVFEPAAEPVTPRGFYTEATDKARLWLRDLASAPNRILEEPALFADYHAELIEGGYGRETARNIQEARKSLGFEEVSKLFKVIDDAGQGVVVSYGNESTTLIETIYRRGHITADERRRLQRYTVSLYPTWVKTLWNDLRPIVRKEPDGLLQYLGAYDQTLGIRLGELPPEMFGVFEG
jgi:CRISPR-associated endonuclease/helicase Cas3